MGDGNKLLPSTTGLMRKNYPIVTPLRPWLIVALFALLTTPFSTPQAHEVSVHQRLTHVAANSSELFQQFLCDNGLLGELAPSHFIESQLAKHEDFYASSHDFLTAVSKEGCTAVNLVRLGSILEDADRRYCNHFYIPTSPTAGHGYKAFGLQRSWCETSCDARTYMMDQDNEFSLAATIGLISEALRHPDQANTMLDAMRALGHIVHLIQDMSQPSHTRNDGHGCRYLHATPPLRCSHFEVYFDQPATRDLIYTLCQMPSTAKLAHPAAACSELANFSAVHFFSDDTVFSPPKGAKTFSARSRRGTTDLPL